MQLIETELDGLIERVKEAKENGLSLTESDMDLVLQMLLSLSDLSEELTENDIKLHKLKKLAGIVKSSEKLLKKSKKLETPKVNEERIVEHKVCNHKIEGLSKGDICPECEKGKLYKYEPSISIRITGSTPLISTKHIRERLRCNACLAYFTAELPKEVVEDGGKDNMYTYSSKSIMSIYKYFGGMPFHRQESLGHIFGMPVSASTIFEQVEYVANAGNVIVNYLKKISSEAFSYQIDDTTNKILNAEVEMKPDRRTGKLRERTGVYTSGLIAQVENYKIVLFQTNIGHSGEFIDEILKNRKANAPPLIMCDALSRNRPSVTDNYHYTLCNAHARRQFFELEHVYPSKVAWVLSQYALIWLNDRKTNEENRLAYHKQHSLPVMIGIKSWCENELSSKQTEENSSLGKAMKYFINNFQGLTAFCHVESAKLDNNEMESTLKLVIRGRKNSLFFKTQNGADIADVLTSIIATCQKNNVNSFDFLTEIQKHSDKVHQKPQDWLPWNYKQTLNSLDNTH